MVPESGNRSSTLAARCRRYLRAANTTAALNPIGLTFQNNTITNNAGSGIELQVNNTEVLNVTIESLPVVAPLISGNQISNNTSFGVHLLGVDTSTINVTTGGAGAAPNTFDLNGDAGLALDLRNNATGSLNVMGTNTDDV